MPKKLSIKLSLRRSVKISKWKVEPGTIVYDGRVLLLYEEDDGKSSKLKSKNVGTVVKLIVEEGQTVNPGDPLLEIDVGCRHPTVINDLCAECGADLQKEDQKDKQATIPMVHSIPQLKVSHEQAQEIGKADVERLIKDRKLVLLVDLDQTLIHTTHDNIPNNLRDVFHFQLLGPNSPWYHTRLRPGTMKFLKNMSKMFELHICTFGVRPYAHMIARILDPDGSLFGGRILSRDECFSSDSKFANLQALFPCGDELVCIIDDREDVWNYSPNLIQVKPYQFFRNTGDIHDPNAPPLHKTVNYLAPGVRVKEKRPPTPEALVPKSGSPEELKEEDEVVKDDIKDEEIPQEVETNDKDPTVTSNSNSKSPVVDESNNINPNDQVVKEAEENVKPKGDVSNTKEVEESKEGSETTKEVNNFVDRSMEEEDKNIEEVCKKMDEEDDSLYKEEISDKSDEKSEKAVDDGMIDVEDDDDYLLYLEAILQRVHRRFYTVHDKKEEGEASMKWVLAKERSSVLKGCVIVFSGLVPLKASLNESGTVLLATKLGAVVEEELSEQTTHLVAAARGTAKVHQAKKMKDVKSVSPHWLLTTAHRWEKVDERLFEVGTGGPLPLSKLLPQQTKDLPQFLTLSQEEMDAMSLEVEDDSSEEDEEEEAPEGEDDDDNTADFSRTPVDYSSESEPERDPADPEEEWSQLGAEIEKGLTDFM
uniref:RNA polymerase II subunit A C-terminal domain phosphatase n=1 Tax=Lygus hesperus TaxID=30085 RepID=A0A146LM22_LYGHE